MKKESKPKTLHRGWWFREWQADEASAWLEDMARQGWMLNHVGLRDAVFKRAEPAEVQYACVLSRNYPSHLEEKEVKKVFAEAGWTYVDFEWKFFIFRAPEGTALPQGVKKLSGDEKRKAEFKHYLSDIILYTLLGLLLGGLFWFSIYEGVMVDYLVNKEADLFWTFLFLSGCLGKIVRGVLGLVRMKKTVEEGNLLNTLTRPYQRTIVIKRAKRVLLIALPLLMLLGDLPRITGAFGEKTWFSSLPCLTMSDMDTAKAKANVPEFLLVKHALLIPDILQAGDESKDEKTILQFCAYHALTPGIARFLASQLAAQGDSFWLIETPLKPQTGLPGFDRAWYSTFPKGDMPCLVAQKGCDVYCLSYSDAMSANDLASALNRKIASVKSP